MIFLERVFRGYRWPTLTLNMPSKYCGHRKSYTIVYNFFDILNFLTNTACIFLSSNETIALFGICYCTSNINPTLSSPQLARTSEDPAIFLAISDHRVVSWVTKGHSYTKVRSYNIGYFRCVAMSRRFPYHTDIRLFYRLRERS